MITPNHIIKAKIGLIVRFMFCVTNKLSIKAIAELIGTTYLNVYYATIIKGTTYEKYFAEIPEPTFIENRNKYVE